MAAPATPAKRADARRNIEAILDAATRLLATDPDASVQDIAKAAGVGRVTLYGHFDSRTALVAQVATRAIDETELALREVDIDGEPRAALARLLEASWYLTHRFGGIVIAAGQALPAEQMQRAHESPAQRVRALLERGRQQGVFRADMPVDWQIITIQAVLHAASGAVHREELAVADAPRLVVETALAVVAAQG
ncbi:TetR/AcrR family transcriptional regulator [Agromyces sp. NPDC058064]|uniref:TetR/AcrR family transcriptional regulator n=1 Tax=Agromyces sp. NPDC058064 TaxID=3346322 RepID=UPI0036DD6355